MAVNLNSMAATSTPMVLRGFLLPMLCASLAWAALFAPCQAKDLPGCQVFNDNQCSGDAIVTNESFAANRWYTPKKGDKEYTPSYQSFSELVAYAQVVYSDASRTSATVTVKTTTRDASTKLMYTFGEGAAAQTSPVQKFDAKTQKDPVVISVTTGEASITLEPVDFIWNVGSLPAPPAGSDYRGGQKGAIVEMFGWPDKDVEKECEFLAKAGYLGVKLYPHQEQLMSAEPFQNLINPWYFMYQPVSYRLQGRMGTRDDLRKLISTCRGLGVRVYADAVINHFTGGGNDMSHHRRQDGGSCTTWPNKSSSLASNWGGPSDGGPSPFYTQTNVFSTSPVTGLPPLNEFPAAAIGPLDFHCERPLNSWTDPLDLNAGWLTGLTDLNTERDHVQERIAAYLTDLMSIGMSGFRVDAAKHIKPDDLASIFKKFKRNMGGELPGDFISWLEVLLGGESDLLMCNGDSGYNYGAYLESALQSQGSGEEGLPGLTASEVLKVKIWNSGYPKETEKGLVNCDGSNSSLTIRSVIQNDDADQQNPGSSSRDMGDTGCVLIKGCSVDEHRGFEVQLFTNPNGAQNNNDDFPIRVVMSSFYWPNASGGSGLQGIPDGKSDCALCTTNCDGCQSVAKIEAYDESSTGYDKDYTRVHRDAEIVQAMRKWVGLSN